MYQYEILAQYRMIHTHTHTHTHTRVYVACFDPPLYSVPVYMQEHQFKEAASRSRLTMVRD